jgi:hypothetical protein
MSMKITCLGQCGFLIEAAGARIVTDPYLSHYLDQNLFSEATPWRRKYPLRSRSLTETDASSPPTLETYGSVHHSLCQSGGEALFAAPRQSAGG